MSLNRKTFVAFLLITMSFSLPVFAEMDLSDDAVVKELKEMAAHGNPEAQLMLADWFFNGLQVEKDVEAAARLYEAAAKQGLMKAQGITGGLYYLGKGVKQDHQLARYWLALAAHQGLEEAEMLLAKMERVEERSTPYASAKPQARPVTMSLNAMTR